MRNRSTIFASGILLFTFLSAGTSVFQNPCDSPNVGGHTGAPGETGCNGCHAGSANTGPAIINFNLGTTSYVPGQTYTGYVNIQQPGMQKFGFVCVALENTNNTTVGNFTILNGARTRKFSEHNRNYVSHTPCGADSADSNTWEFEWTAPSTAHDTITMYLGTLAANHDHALTGDYGYELKIELPLQITSVEEHTNNTFHIYPNPVHSEFAVVFMDAFSGDTYLTDLQGRKVSAEFERINAKQIKFTLSDKIPSGIYLLSLSSESLNHVTRIVKL